MYTLDTNTLIYFFKGIGNVAEILLSHSPKDILISSVTLYELEVGIAKSSNPNKRRKQLEALTSRLSISVFGAKEAKIAAIVRANLESKGTPIGHYDTLIAGIAISTNSTLVTHNTKEFRRVADLNIVDWF